MHKPAEPRLQELDISGQNFLEVFHGLIADAESAGQNGAGVTLEFIEPGDDFIVGTYVPQIILVVNKVLPDDNTGECGLQAGASGLGQASEDDLRGPA